MGVIRSVNAPTYDMAVSGQVNKIQKTSQIKNMDDLLKSGSVWEVK
jgi:hypothetical protein